ncbi:MAG: hypothetical protein K9N55_09590 [Phycisphaerae bacterium]|nr:hypothetical protein [Phycisphaerae bacterium]
MIDKALRDYLRPLVRRRLRLFLAWRLALCWLALAGVGLIGLGLSWAMAWPTTVLFWGLLAAGVPVTLWLVNHASKQGPDFQALARSIEETHPDAKALIQTAVEQSPQALGEPLNYLQKQVIREALMHAAQHDWMQSVPARTLFLSELVRYGALAILAIVLFQTVPRFSWLPAPVQVAPQVQDTVLMVSPGDTSVEQGSPVVIVARFEGPVPDEAMLVYSIQDEPTLRVALSKTLNDPVFGGMIPSVVSDAIYHVEYADLRSPQYSIAVFRHPELEQADATIMYPEYTGLSDKQLKDTQRYSAVEGSQVTVTLTLNKAVASARLTPKQGTEPVLTVDPTYPNVYTTVITAAKSQQFVLALTDAEGRTNKIPPRFQLDVHQNMPVTITPKFPSRDVQASPLEELALEAEVSDDYGVLGFGLVYGMAGAPPKTVTLGGNTDAGDKIMSHHVLALEDVNAQPDQLLSYYYWADDLGPDGIARRTTSDIYFAEIRPFEEIFRESESFMDAQAQEQQAQEESQDPNGQQEPRLQGDQLAQLQKQIMTATWNIKQRTDLGADANAVTEDLTLVRDSQSDALASGKGALEEAEDAEAARSLAAATEAMDTALGHLSQAVESGSGQPLPEAMTAEQLAYQALLELREREHQITQSRNNNRQRAQNSQQFEQQLNQLELRQQEDRYESQRMAQNQNQTQQREDLQVLNRLRDLAKRQEDMANRLREAEAALQQAQDEQAREEAQRQLKRLRDEQMQALDDMDELQQRMNSEQNRQRMAEAQEQLDQTRTRIQQSTEQMEQGQVSSAANSTTRAQRELEAVRDDFQRSTSSQFESEVRNLREQARDLDQAQQAISEQIREQTEARQARRSLSDSNAVASLSEQLTEQQDKARELIDDMKEVSDASEASEPLLSRKLYETLRRTGTDNLDQALEVTEELVRRNFLTEAQRIEQRASEGVRTLREGVEEAAQSVLGDPTDALRQAQEQLDTLIDQVEEEVAQAQSSRAGQGTPSDSNQPGQGQGAPGTQRAQSDPMTQGAERAQASQEGQPGQPGQQAQQGQPGQQARQGQQGQSGQPGQADQEGQRARQGQDGQDGQAQRNRPGQNGNRGGMTGPLTGEENTNWATWSDRLRDVEEILDDQDWRNEAAGIRDRARTVRAEFVRHGTEPQWDLVRQSIMQPLVDLRKQVKDELARLQKDLALVPIDRDPVPGLYEERVKRYFETLGADQ